jgi:hypothetical protein
MTTANVHGERRPKDAEWVEYPNGKLYFTDDNWRTIYVSYRNSHVGGEGYVWRKLKDNSLIAHSVSFEMFRQGRMVPRQ